MTILASGDSMQDDDPFTKLLFFYYIVHSVILKTVHECMNGNQINK